ncbi:MAG: GTP-binding protein [Polyangiaceae bacterium]
MLGLATGTRFPFPNRSFEPKKRVPEDKSCPTPAFHLRPSHVDAHSTSISTSTEYWLGTGPPSGAAITLVESVRAADESLSEKVLLQLLPHSGKALRLGITGIPGAGKSTFIEALGKRSTAQGHKVAVLAVDLSSAITGGSILGDKTRMVELSADPRAFIRPTPSSCALGGVARKTRETMVLCEASGFDVILVETVGVGLSETMVDGMARLLLGLDGGWRWRRTSGD